MQDSSVTPSSHRLAATPALEYTFSSSSSSHGGGQGGGEPPPFPKFNVPDSYWSRMHAPSNVERLFEQCEVDAIARRRLQSSEGRDLILKILENQQESTENDPRIRMAGAALLLDFRPVQVPDLVLPADVLAQQAAATGGCCIPPGCNIV